MKSQSVTIQMKATEQYFGAFYYALPGDANVRLCE